MSKQTDPAKVLHHSAIAVVSELQNARIEIEILRRDAHRYRFLRDIYAWKTQGMNTYWEPSIRQSPKSHGIKMTQINSGIHLDIAVDELMETHNANSQQI